jgi:hypothetical protein
VIDNPLTITDAEQRLLELMRTAIFAGNGKKQPSCEAFVAALISEKDPAPLLRVIFESARCPCIDQLFTKIRRESCAEGAIQPAAAAVTGNVPKGHGVPAAAAAGTNAAGGVNVRLSQDRYTGAPSPRTPTRPDPRAVENVARSVLRAQARRGRAQ